MGQNPQLEHLTLNNNRLTDVSALAMLMHVQNRAASLLTTNPHTLQVRVIQRLRLNSVTA